MSDGQIGTDSADVILLGHARTITDLICKDRSMFFDTNIDKSELVFNECVRLFRNYMLDGAWNINLDIPNAEFYFSCAARTYRQMEKLKNDSYTVKRLDTLYKRLNKENPTAKRIEVLIELSKRWFDEAEKHMMAVRRKSSTYRAGELPGMSR